MYQRQDSQSGKREQATVPRVFTCIKKTEVIIPSFIVIRGSMGTINGFGSELLYWFIAPVPLLLVHCVFFPLAFSPFFSSSSSSIQALARCHSPLTTVMKPMNQ